MHPTNDDVINDGQKITSIDHHKNFFLETSRRDMEFVDTDLKRFFDRLVDKNC